MLSLQWPEVLFLVGELRPHKPHGVARKKKKLGTRKNFAVMLGAPPRPPTISPAAGSVTAEGSQFSSSPGIVFLCQGFYSFTRGSQHPMADQGRGVKTQSPSSLWDVSERLPSSRTSSGVNWGSFGSWGAVQFLPLPILLPHTQEQCSLRAPFNKHHEDTFWSQNLFLGEPDQCSCPHLWFSFLQFY